MALNFIGYYFESLGTVKTVFCLAKTGVCIGVYKIAYEL
jgi:hypothetical protein